MSKPSSPFMDSVQAMPNYPPYALSLVSKAKDLVVFGGNISQALIATMDADRVLACDINEKVVDFYRAIVEEMKTSKSRTDFLPRFHEMLGKLKKESKAVSEGPYSFVPFLLDDNVYSEVRDGIGKATLYHTDLSDFLNWMREEKMQPGLIDANNIPEYISDWTNLFRRPPLQDGGMLLFGKRDLIAYSTPENTIHPGHIRKSLVGYDISPAPADFGMSVLDAMRYLGYVPFEAPVISSIVESEGGIEFVIKHSTKGYVTVPVIEQRYQDSQLTSIRGGIHNIFTLQYNPAAIKPM